MRLSASLAVVEAIGRATLALRAADPFWQARYYDLNVWSERKFVEKLRYIHWNPVQRALVARPEEVEQLSPLCERRTWNSGN